MRRRLLLLLVFWVALSAPARADDAGCPPVASDPTAEEVRAAAREARDRGFLWRITKAGRASYLYGTVHVGKLAWAVPGRAIAAALRATDVLALELDVTDPVIAEKLARLSLAGPSAPVLPPKLRERLDRQARAACVASAIFAPLHPVMQAISLTTLAGRRDGLDPAFAQELSLSGAARALSHGIVSLETVEVQMEALVPDDDETAIEMIEETVAQLEEDRLRPVLRKVAATWADGDLAALDDYESWCDCATNDEEREFLRRVNDGRNPHLATGIDALHLEGRRVFAAVGALHMTGERSLPKLLAERGYRVERVAFPR